MIQSGWSANVHSVIRRKLEGVGNLIKETMVKNDPYLEAW